MYKELLIYNDDVQKEDIRDSLFAAIKCSLHGIVVQPVYLSTVANFIPDGFVVSTIINTNQDGYFNAILACARRKCNAVNLVVNNALLVNKEYSKIMEVVEGAKNICNDNNITLRCMIDYRLLEREELYKVCSLLKDLNLEYLYITSDHFNDDYIDNLLVCIDIQEKYGINMITNSRIYHYSQYENIEKSGVFGFSFYSKEMVYNVTTRKFNVG